ncbi:MAG: TetR/AcrR family transcriptional regulator [Chitinophagaceae bacterium]|nr:TetR/AcrR family transcriptional regulator [Chitinophagaceae bacterium]MCB0700530.1 TetR/AcrR family transcriptional regulator [Chitinophagaceae bacterium]
MVKKDSSTEEKIKNAARAVFHKKGYAATKTRDIAEEADINLALLNYYFGSKENLFNVVVIETLQTFFQSMLVAINDTDSTLEAKIEIIVDKYTDLLINEPQIPVFIMSEIRNDAGQLLDRLPIKKMLWATILKQLTDEREKHNLPPMNPIYFITALLGLVVFPFTAGPIVKHLGDMSQEDFNNMMLERKKLVPGWIMGIIRSDIKEKKQKNRI